MAGPVQNQYAKVMRVADLARTASKQSSGKLAKYKRELAAAQEEAALHKKVAGAGRRGGGAGRRGGGAGSGARHVPRRVHCADDAMLHVCCCLVP